MTEEPSEFRGVDAVMQTNTARLMSIPGVVGVAVGLTRHKTPCILVLVVRRTTELKRSVPTEIEGYPVEMMVTGEIRGLRGKDS